MCKPPASWREEDLCEPASSSSLQGPVLLQTFAWMAKDRDNSRSRDPIVHRVPCSTCSGLLGGLSGNLHGCRRMVCGPLQFHREGRRERKGKMTSNFPRHSTTQAPYSREFH